MGRAVFIASRTPWRMAQIRTGTTRPDDTAVVAWADDSTAVLKGNPAEQVLVESNDSWGDLGLGQMLLPHSLDPLAPPPWPRQFQINGAALEGEGMFIAPGLVSLASDSYEADQFLVEVPHLDSPTSPAPTGPSTLPSWSMGSLRPRPS